MLTQPDHWHMNSFFFLKPFFVDFSSLKLKKTWLEKELKEMQTTKAHGAH